MSAADQLRFGDPLDPRPSETTGPRNPPSPRLLLTVRETARALGIGRSTVYELIHAGELEVIHIGRSCRVPVAVIEAYVERLKQS